MKKLIKLLMLTIISVSFISCAKKCDENCDMKDKDALSNGMDSAESALQTAEEKAKELAENAEASLDETVEAVEAVSEKTEEAKATIAGG
jgi:hypothetical protein